MHRLLTYQQRSEVMEKKEYVLFSVGLIALVLLMLVMYRVGQMNVQADCERIGAFRIDGNGFKCEVMK